MQYIRILPLKNTNLSHNLHTGPRNEFSEVSETPPPCPPSRFIRHYLYVSSSFKERMKKVEGGRREAGQCTGARLFAEKLILLAPVCTRLLDEHV